MLAYLANTLIFMLVGMMITTKAVKNVSDSDWVLTIALYCAVTIIRYGAYYYAGELSLWYGVKSMSVTRLMMIGWIAVWHPQLDIHYESRSKLLMSKSDPSYKNCVFFKLNEWRIRCTSL